MHHASALYIVLYTLVLGTIGFSFGSVTGTIGRRLHRKHRSRLTLARAPQTLTHSQPKSKASA